MTTQFRYSDYSVKGLKRSRCSVLSGFHCQESASRAHMFSIFNRH